MMPILTQGSHKARLRLCLKGHCDKLKKWYEVPDKGIDSYVERTRNGKTYCDHPFTADSVCRRWDEYVLTHFPTQADFDREIDKS